MYHHTRSPARRTLALLSTLWILGIAYGSWKMLLHEFDAPAPGETPDTIPPSIAAHLPETERLRLVIAIHPDCPCTAASVEQLDRLLTRFPDSFAVLALFADSRDAEAERDLESNRYWKRLSEMSGTRLVNDPQGELSDTLGASASGTTLAFDRHDKLRFHGGLTASRGHAGSSSGLDALLALAAGNDASTTNSAPAFGCELATQLSSGDLAATHF